jgi:hypothetical protein
MIAMEDTMGLKSLAEAVILQSLEDFWSLTHRQQSMDFFKGEGFKICSSIAELDAMKQIEILCFLGGESHGKSVRLH